MATHSLHLPILQNWSCHNCGGCCTQHEITITAEEKRRIEGQGWRNDPEISPSQAIFHENRSWLAPRTIRLAHQPDGGCVFLRPDGLCRIHAKFGEQAKPLACQVYPYTFHPKDHGLTLSLRFSCPSVARNLGKPVREQSKELKQLAKKVVPENYRTPTAPATTTGSSLNWQDTEIIVNQLDRAFADNQTPLVVQLLRSLFWVGLLEESKIKAMSGTQLRQVLNVLAEGAELEIAAEPEITGDVTKIGMSQFRLLAGQYARKTTQSNLDVSLWGRLSQLSNALKLTSGRGTLPEIGDGFAAIKSELVDQSQMTIPTEIETIFRRFLRVKIQGYHFFGKPYYDFPLTIGFAALALTIPATIWIAKWRVLSAGKSMIEVDDLIEALNLVDHQHGFSPALGGWHSRRRIQNFWANEDLQKIVARQMLKRSH